MWFDLVLDSGAPKHISGRVGHKIHEAAVFVFGSFCISAVGIPSKFGCQPKFGKRLSTHQITRFIAIKANKTILHMKQIFSIVMFPALRFKGVPLF
jgi:hypothetical protein